MATTVTTYGEARRQTDEVRVEDRHRAVRAITQRNALEKLVARTKTALQTVEAVVQAARAQGNHIRERGLLVERDVCQQSLDETQADLQAVLESIGVVKTALRQQKEEIRRKNAQELLNLTKRGGGGPGGSATA